MKTWLGLESGFGFGFRFRFRVRDRVGVAVRGKVWVKVADEDPLPTVSQVSHLLTYFTYLLTNFPVAHSK